MIDMFYDCKNPKELYEKIKRFLDDPNEFFSPTPTWAVGNVRTKFNLMNLEYNLKYDDLQNIASVIYDDAIKKYLEFRHEDNSMPLLPQIKVENPNEKLTLFADFLIGINQPQRNGGEKYKIEKLYIIAIRISELIKNEKILQEFRDQCKYFFEKYDTKAQDLNLWELLQLPEFIEYNLSIQTEDIIQQFFSKPNYKKRKFSQKLIKAANYVLFSVIHDNEQELLKLGYPIINNGIWDDEDFNGNLDICSLYEMIVEGWKYPTIREYICSRFRCLEGYIITGQENSIENKETAFPKNKMALTVIPSVFKISERTLYRKIKDGTFTSYPDVKGKIFLDTVAVAERYKRLK